MVPKTLLYESQLVYYNIYVFIVVVFLFVFFNILTIYTHWLFVYENIWNGRRTTARFIYFWTLFTLYKFLGEFCISYNIAPIYTWLLSETKEKQQRNENIIKVI